MIGKFARYAFPAALVLAGLWMTADMWGDFQLGGHSAYLDYFRQISFDRCIRAGILYPRWMPDTYYGYGSPMFHFYAPLPYYITESFMLLGAPAQTALKMAMVFGLILSGLGMYLFCRDFAGRTTSFVAGLAFMMAPYHMVDMLVRHAFGEHMAFAFIPFTAWGITGMLQGKRGVRLAVGALSFAALILTHNVTAMLAMGAFGLWWIALFIYTRNKKGALWGVKLLVLGLLIAGFFWIPVMAEKDLTYAEEALTSGYFVYSDHFVYPFQLLTPNWGYGGSRKGVAEDRMSYQVGFPHWFFFLCAVAFFVVGFGKDRRIAFFTIYGLVLFLGSVMLCTPAGAWVYKIVPILKFIQFPWRFLVFVAFASSLLAVCMEPLAKMVKSPYALPVYALCACLALMVFYGKYTRSNAYYYFVDHHTFARVSLKKMKKLEGSIHHKRIWELGGVNFMRATGEPGTSRDDYLPRTVDVRYKPTRIPEAEVEWQTVGPVNLEWENDGPVNLKATVYSEAGGTLEFARFYFPGWKAKIDGKPAKTNPQDPRGTILLQVPPGRHEVHLYFGSTPFRTACALLSLFSLLLLVFYVFWERKSREKSTVIGIES